ncbi:hypothetical protein ACOSQ3_004063 [Xanthoceras sorbifolium]
MLVLDNLKSKKTMATKLVPKIEVADFFRGRVTCLSSLMAICNIIWKLTESQKKMFECSCFGHLLEMNELVFPSQTVHELLLREVESPNTDEMWFKVGDNGIRFSIQEFCIVTGLNCGPYPSVVVDKKVTSFGLIDGLLNGDMNLDNTTLEDVFMKASFSDDLTMVKLALLYCLENVFLGREKGSPIDSEHIRLVDDLDQFNEYPWGRVCFEMTMSSLQNALKGRVQMLNDRDKKKSKQNWEAYSLQGFPWAFQVWAYEAIPTLGHKSAHKLACGLPRLVDWQSKRSPNYMELQKIFWQENLQTHAVLQPTPEEEQQRYWQHFISLGGASNELLTFVQGNATSAAAAPLSIDANAITNTMAVKKTEKRNPPIEDTVVTALKKCKKDLPRLHGFHQEQGLALQELPQSLPSTEELTENESTSPPLPCVSTVALQSSALASAPISTPLQGSVQPSIPSLDEAQAFFTKLAPILDESVENLLQSSQAMLDTPEDIWRAKCFLTQCRSSNFEFLMKPGRREQLNSSLELLLKNGYFPSSMLDFVRSFQMKFLRNTCIYSNCQESVKRANKNKEDAKALRGELAKSCNNFDQVMRDIQLRDDMIEELTKKLEEQKKLKADLEEQAKDLVKSSMASKDALARCVLNHNTLEKDKQDSKKLKADIDASWEEFRQKIARFF